MMKNYRSGLNLHSSARKGFGRFALLVCVAAFTSLTAQQTYTFTACGATGNFGPTQTQVSNTYANTNLSLVATTSATSGIQTFTVPFSGNYRIEAIGAQGGDGAGQTGGLGASCRGDFSLTAGTILKVLVGQRGGSRGNNGSNSAGAGGGGSFVSDMNNNPLVVAGGGGGAGAQQAGLSGTVGLNGTQSTSSPGMGGINGGGGGGATNGTAGTSVTPGGVGSSCSYGAGGGGYYTRGGYNCSGNPPLIAGESYTAGGFGGIADVGNGGVAGGFGCGAGVGHRASGGGGWSGGGGDGGSSAGGGGGSYNGGTNQVNASGVNSGDGRVIITELCNISLVASSNPICAGSTVTLTTNAVSNYSWSNGSTASSIIVTPAVTTTYSLVGTSSLNCVAGNLVTLTVSPGLPVLAITSSTDNLCLGKDATLTASGALTYTWSNGVTNGVTFTPSVTTTYTVTGENGCGTTSAVTTITVAPLPVTVQNTPSISCAGLPSTLVATSAVNAYTWQPIGLFGATIVVSPTVNTVYTVTASDGTCSGIATLSLNTLPVPTINIAASTSVTCAGFPVTMSASGGISYTWMPGNLSGPTVTVYPTGPTLYTVNGVNSVGCVTGTTQIMLTDPSPTVNVTASSTIVCQGDQVTLVASGNAAGYQWTGGPQNSSYPVNPQTTTVYTVTGTSSTNTCTTTRTIVVNVFAPVLTITSSTTTVCSGESVNITASGADDYIWINNGATSNMISVAPAVTTVYSVNATATNSTNLSCSVSGSIQISVNPNPTVTATSSRTLICLNESTDLNASGATSYSWSTGATVASTMVTPANITIHTYTLTGTDANGCSDNTTILIRVAACNSISESIPDEFHVTAYPNPSKGEITISSDIGLDLKLVNVLGQEIRKITLSKANNYTSRISGLPEGIYFLVDSGKNYSGKILVE